MGDSIKVKVSRRGNALRFDMPSYMTPSSSGVDLRAAEEKTIEPGSWALIGTGLYLEIPIGYEAQVRPRSGLALKHGVTVLNAPGTIDADYRGEVGVILINLGREPFEVKVGDRIAQLVISAVCRVGFEEVESLSETARGAGGFGSTGLK